MVDNTKPIVPAALAALGLAQTTGGSSAGASHALINGQIDVSTDISGNCTCTVLTLSGENPSETNPVFCGFRTRTGSYQVRAIDAGLSLTIPSDALLGVDDDNYRIWWGLVDVGDGSVLPAARNCSTGTQIFPLAEYAFATTTSIGSGSDSAGVFYAASAVSDKPFRIIGFSDWDHDLVGAGEWDDPEYTILYAPGTPTPGGVVQRVVHQRTDSDTLAASVSWLSSLPQISEGNEIFSETIAPISPRNLIEIEVAAFLYSTGVGNASRGLGIFFDGAANAVAGSIDADSKGSSPGFHYGFFRRRVQDLVGAVSVRVSSLETIYFNRVPSNATLMGGVLQSSVKITELMG